MTVDPYRSPAPFARRDDGPFEFFYRPRTTKPLAEGTRLFIAIASVGGIGGALIGFPILGTCTGVIFGMLGAFLKRRKGDTAGIRFRLQQGVLTIGRGRSGSIPILEAPLVDVLDVKLESETFLATIGNLVAAPGFGMAPPDAGRRAFTVDESRVAVCLRTRAEPIRLTTDRMLDIEATEWLEEIHRFLRARGWSPLHEKVELATEARTILATRVAGTEYAIRTKMRASAFVLQAERLGPGDNENVSFEYVIGANALPTFTQRLLAASEDAERYEELEEDEMLAELVRVVFVNRYGTASIAQLTEWLDREAIAYDYVKN